MTDYGRPVMMKQKIFRSLLAFAVAIFLLVQEATVLAVVLGVPEKFQEKDQWCWAGTSQAIMQYYKKVVTQTNIALYGTSGYNTWNYLYGSDSEAPYYRKGISMILNNWGLSCTYGAYTMSQVDVQNQINSSRPFVIRWGWSSGGGHFLAGRGIDGNYVYYMDPWPGEGYKMALYSWVVDDGNHEWTHSLKLTTSPQIPNLRYWNAPNGSFKVSPQTGLNWGSSVTTYYGLANVGTGDIPAGTRYHFYFYLSTNSTISTSDYYWKGYYSDAGLPAGYGIYNNFTQALPSSPPAGFPSSGTVYIGMIVDPLNEIAESNESDNSNQGLGKDYSYVSISGGTAPSAPTNVSASDGTYTDKVRITWSASSGATSYDVYRATSSGGTKTKIGTPSTTLYDDTSASVGTTYYYWVTAKNTWGTSGYSSYNTGYRNPCPDCSGGTIENFTFKSGTTCECACSGLLTIGAGVTIESGATVTFKAPTIKVQSGFRAYEGAKVYMKQQ